MNTKISKKQQMKHQYSSKSSLLMLTGSMIIFGTIGIFRRSILLSSGMLAFGRGVIGVLFLCAFMMVRRNRKNSGTNTADIPDITQPEIFGTNNDSIECSDGGPDIPQHESSGSNNDYNTVTSNEPKISWFNRIGMKNLTWLIISGAAIGFNWMLLFEAYNYTTVSVATLCYYMQPTIVILLSPLLLHEKLTVRKLICAGAAILGMIFVSGVLDAGGVPSGSFRGVLCGLGAAALYASVIIMNKKITGISVIEKTILQLTAATVVMIPYLVITENFSQIQPDGTSIMLLLVVGLVHTGMAYAMYFGSMDGLKGQTIAIFSYIDPITALILSAIILKESLSVLGIIGAVLILGAAAVSEIKSA